MATERVRVRPARKGLLVPDPDHGGRALPAEGTEVALSSYWVRRIEDGDVLAESLEASSSTARKIAEPAPRPKD